LSSLDYPVMVSADLSVAVKSLKTVEVGNSVVGLLDILTSVSQVKNLSEAREKAIISQC